MDDLVVESGSCERDVCRKVVAFTGGIGGWKRSIHLCDCDCDSVTCSRGRFEISAGAER